MHYTTLFAISGALTSIFCFLLVGILLKYGKTFLHRIWAIFNLFVALWGIGCIWAGSSSSLSTATNAWKFALLGYFISPIFYHTTIIYTKKSSKFLIILGYIYATTHYVLTLLFLPKNHFASVIPTFGSLYFLRATSLADLLFHLIWIFYAIIGNLTLFSYYKSGTGVEEKSRTLYFFLPMLIGFLGGTMNVLVMANVLLIFPYGNFSIPIYCAIVTYAFLKHELVDIKIVIQKGMIYSILITIVSIIYILIVFISEKIAQQILGYRSLTISIVTAFLLGLILVPLRHRIQRFVDRYFFKGTQEEIAQQNVQLRQEIAQSEKYKTLSTLASGIAHEIKNPLTAMKTFCEYLPRKLDDREFLLKFSRLVGKEVERIDGMVHELLDYSKPVPLALKKTDINKLIQDTLNTLNSQFIKNRIEVTQHPSTITYHLNVDANRIKQALLNLFLNAIEAMPHGGKLTASSFVARTSYIVTIADTGSGIPSEDLKHIFDPFFSRKDHGTGLGLAIVQGIMEQHRGKVRITSQVGVGTEVRLEFPLGVD